MLRRRFAFLSYYRPAVTPSWNGFQHDASREEGIQDCTRALNPPTSPRASFCKERLQQVPASRSQCRPAVPGVSLVQNEPSVLMRKGQVSCSGKVIPSTSLKRFLRQLDFILKDILWQVLIHSALADETNCSVIQLPGLYYPGVKLARKQGGGLTPPPAPPREHAVAHLP